ncbi:MAG TPA: hypothetical protein VMV94_11940 [Phycisphaerae bacterium]|nr:hypothetical protein [Phycisphaerae bacterium]
MARRRRARADELSSLFPSLCDSTKRFGISVLLAVAERWGKDGEVRCARQEALFAKPGLRPKTSLLDRANPDILARTLSGVAHPDRIRLARAILTGANTHQLLAKAVSLKTGPLYHHLRELERAGLLSMKSRNAYVLTNFGRIVLYVATVLGVQAASPDKELWNLRHIPRKPSRVSG